jgi:hypothetical protein
MKNVLDGYERGYNAKALFTKDTKAHEENTYKVSTLSAAAAHSRHEVEEAGNALENASSTTGWKCASSPLRVLDC